MAFFRRKKKEKNDKGQTAPSSPEPSGDSLTQDENTPDIDSLDHAPEVPDQNEPLSAGSEEDQAQAEPGRTGILSRMFSRLGKTRDKISGSIDRITLGRKIDDEVLDDLEEVLVTADLGVKTSLALIEDLRGKVGRSQLGDAQMLKDALRSGIKDILEEAACEPSRQNDPHVVLVVGVNGVGKTTTIGKLAHHFSSQGRKVLLAAADTFRAAAIEQLEVWAQRTGCPVVRQQHGADPSAVAYDALEAAIARSRDLVIVDTAGRLHTKVNLMEELKKIHRVLGKRLPGAPHEVLLVLDATTGQNALNQAKLFHEAVPLSGVVLTKLDGTAKGGIVVAIASEMKLPICFVGLGEGVEDLRPFEAEAFAEAIF
ncbi:MAG: signal recognition particle-docking protein FtsY [Desulfarculaceae bacterium]|jgi:fused signal recognition particle receptor